MLIEYRHFLRKLKESLPLLWDNLQDPSFDGWLLIRWTVQALAITLAILLADYLTGAGLLSALRVRVPGRLRLTAALATGIALQGLLIFALALTGHLTEPAVRMGGIALGLAGLIAVWRMGTGPAYLVRAWQVLRPGPLWIALLVSPFALVYLADLMQPVSEIDSTMYHMAAARWYGDHAALPYHPDLRFNAQPQLSVLLYWRHWMLAGEDTVLKLFNLELVLLLVAALLAGLRELRIRERGLALLLLAASPVFVWVAKVEYADLAVSTFVTAGGVLLLAALPRRSVALVALAGVALAAAGASKLQGLLLAVILLAAFALVAWRARWPARSLVTAVTLASALIVTWGAGWWIRSWLATGSPAYPFFTHTDELARLMEVNQRYGFGRSFTALLLLPVRAVFAKPENFADAYTFGPALLLAALSGVALVWRRRLTPSLSFLAVSLGLFFAFWFFSGQVLRYWASTLGLQALWICAGLGSLPRAASLRWVLAAGLSVCAALNIAITSPTLRNGFPPPVTFSQKETVEAESLRYYRAVRVINQTAEKSARVYALFTEDARFHLRRPNAGDWFGQHSYFWLADQTPDEAGIVARLRAAGYRWLLFDRARGKERGGVFPFEFSQTELMRTWGTPPGTRRIFDDGQYTAFEILPGIK